MDVTHDAAAEVLAILKKVASGNSNLPRHEADRLAKQMKTATNPAGTWSATGTYTSTS